MMFEIGTQVIATDEESGRLQCLILDPHTHDVTDLVVGIDKEDSRIVSVADVGHVSAEAIRLNVSGDELRRRRKFSHEEMVVPGDEVGAQPVAQRDTFMWANPYQGTNVVLPPAHPMTRVQVSYGVGDRFTIIGRETPVFTRGGKRVGTVDHLAVDPDDYSPRAIIVRLPGIRRRRVMVQTDQVLEWERGALVIDLNRDQLKALPPYHHHRPDSAISRDVRTALLDSGLDLATIAVDVNDGHVILRGRAGSDDDRRGADGVARQVPGVLSLDNQLVTDRLLRTRVEARLMEDPVASLYPVDVTADRGTVILTGELPNEAIRQIVIHTAEETAGVVRVTDELQERPERFEGPVPAAKVNKSG